jgi:hypothetical protein
VLGLIKAIHIRSAVLAPGGEVVDAAKLRPIARLGGISYSRLGDVFEIARPPWKHAKDTLREDETQKNREGSEKA